ncbi:MAG: EAL domain-containing protein [Oscillospiraceae bacterium]|nr:EAL domain-containing protein [Oscillospiraceae bacterium]
MDINERNIEKLIDIALKNKDIVVYYQPKYDAVTSRLCGAEALARWKLEDGSVLSPGCFIPLLEKNGLIIKLDWYMYGETCAFIRKLMDEGIEVVTISANFSRLHTFEGDAFIPRLCETADRLGIPHKYLEVEITESTFENLGTNIREFIADIRNAGFNVSIDDFGSGLSSLSFVKDVPANVLKIDKSLISGNCENEKERIVLESIFNFAHKLNFTTVAEGVETKEQLGFLRTCGCKVIQGYIFAKPMPQEEFENVCKKPHAKVYDEDILLTQPSATADELLMQAVFRAYPLVIFSNLSRNSFYMMAYSNFTTRSCPSAGVYTELIMHGASTMHPDDKELFISTFDIQSQKQRYENGEDTISVVTRQKGDDGIYRPVETTNYYVKNPSADDLLAITLSRPLGDA